MGCQEAHLAGAVAAIRSYCGWIFDCRLGALPQVLFVVNCILSIDTMAILLCCPVILTSRETNNLANTVAFADLVKSDLKVTHR